MNLIHLETRHQKGIDIWSYFCYGFDLVLTKPWLILQETCFRPVAGFICNMTNINSLGIAKCRILSLVISVQMLLFDCNDSFGFYAVLVFCHLSLPLKLMWLTTTSHFCTFVLVCYFCIRVDDSFVLELILKFTLNLIFAFLV